MARVYLIRHGQTEWNVTKRVMGRTDVPLNAAGRAQARALAEVMRGLQIDALYSSPQLRARQTAEALAAATGLPVRVEEALSEVDFPRWIGWSWEKLSADPVYDSYRRTPATARLPEFEPIPDVKARTSAWVESLARENSRGRYACVSHADPLRTILSHALNGALNDMRRFRIANASLSVIDKEGERWLLKLFNYRPDFDLDSDL